MLEIKTSFGTFGNFSDLSRYMKEENKMKGERIKQEYEKIMSTTKEGDIVVLIETESNTYMRTKKGLKRIETNPLSVEKVKNHHRHQFQ